MTFDEILDHVLEMLQRRGRVSYRVLKHQFDLDDAYREDLKTKMITFTSAGSVCRRAARCYRDSSPS